MNERQRRTIATIALGLALALIAGATGCSVLDTTDKDEGTSDVTSDSLVGAPGPTTEERSAAEADQSAVAPPGGAGADAASVPPADRLVVRTAGLRLRVDDIDESVDEVRSQAEQVGGMVTDVQVSTEVDVPLYRYDAQGTLSDGAALSGWVTVRVPSDSYGEFVDSVRELGEVVRESESESDVTQQHIDLQARLDNIKAQELRLREFFEQAVDVEDLLAIEQELTRVRAEIDSLEAQIAFLERQASMSTVTIELVGPQPIVSPQGESWGFVEAITTGIRGAAGVVRFTIAFIIATSPVWLSALIVGLIVRVIVRRRRASRSTSVSE